MISRKWLWVMFALAAGTVIAWGTMRSLASTTSPLPLSQGDTGNPDEPRREIEGNPESPLISFIDSPSAVCYQPVGESNACYIQWSYLYVNATASQYMISMTVNIDGHLRSYTSGFFQTYMYIPPEMYYPGLKVACGAPGSGGYPDRGRTYSYTIRARETGGLGAANYGSVTCPPVNELYLPVIRKH